MTNGRRATPHPIVLSVVHEWRDPGAAGSESRLRPPPELPVVPGGRATHGGAAPTAADGFPPVSGSQGWFANGELSSRPSEGWPGPLQPVTGEQSAPSPGAGDLWPPAAALAGLVSRVNHYT